MYINNKAQDYYNPGKSGSVSLKSENGPKLAFFGEIHPAIVSNIDLKEKNVCGFEIFKVQFKFAKVLNWVCLV